MKKKDLNRVDNHGPNESPNQKHHELLIQEVHHKDQRSNFNKAATHRRLENRRSGRH